MQLGVIGLGSIGHRHLANLHLLFPDATLLAVSASADNNTTTKAALPDYVTPASLTQLVSAKPDFVIVASPASLHQQHTEQLLAAGIAVLVEKPLTATAEQSQQLLATAQHFPDSIVDVGYCLRFLPAAQQLKAVLQTGHLGRVFTVIAQVGQFLPHWRPGKDYRQSVSARQALGGGALLELSHELDYLQWLFGTLRLNYARNRRSGLLELDVEDISELFLTTANGISTVVHLDFVQQHAFRRCSIIAEHGRLEWDLVANTLCLFQHEKEQMLYQDDSYDKNNMYLDMLSAFWQKVQQKNSCKAALNNAASLVQLIERAKVIAPPEIL